MPGPQPCQCTAKPEPGYKLVKELELLPISCLEQDVTSANTQYIYIYIYTHIFTHTHTYIYIYIDIYTHTKSVKVFVAFTGNRNSDSSVSYCLKPNFDYQANASKVTKYTNTFFGDLTAITTH